MYCTPAEVWNWLNKYTRIREELASASASPAIRTYDLSNSNVISGSVNVKYGVSGGYITASTLTSSEYSSDYDNGVVTLTTAGAATVSGGYLWIDYNHGVIPNSVMVDLISSGDKEIERRLGRNFNSNSAEVDYFSVDSGETEFFLRHYPVLSVSSVEVNESDVTDTPSWTTLSAGMGNDYLITDYDKEIGRIRIIDNKPSEGTDNLKVTYDWGYTSVPYPAKATSILMTIKSLMDNPVFQKSLLEGQDTFVGLRTDQIENEIEKKLESLKRMQFIKI